MITVGTKIDLHLDEVDDRFRDMEHRAKVLGPALRAMRRPLIADQREHAKEESGPSSKWPPRAAITEARRKSRNRRTKQTKSMRMISPKPSKRKSTPRRLLGRLPMIFQLVTTQLSLSMRSRAPWSGAHMTGAKVGHGRKVKLPRRVYYYLSDKLVGTAREVFAQHIVKDWTK